MIFVLYAALAAVVVFLALKLSKYVDLIDKMTSVSGAFIGGVLLAAITSLPELFTSISATLFINKNEMVIGNILGSNLFNFVILAMSVLFFIKSFKTAKLSKAHFKSCAFIVLITGLVALGVYLPVKIGWLNLMSPVILGAYIAFIALTPSKSEKKENFTSPLTLKQIIIRFILASVLLVAASIGITYVSDIVAVKLNLGMTFAGALLLGVATSLPELTSTIALCKKGNFDAGLSNVLGSNVFNYVILVISDLLSFKKGITNVFVNNLQSMYLIIFVAASAFIVFGLILYKQSKRVNSALMYTVSGVSSAAIIALYIAFIILSV